MGAVFLFNDYFSWFLSHFYSLSWYLDRFVFYGDVTLLSFLVTLIILGIIFRSLIMRS